MTAVLLLAACVERGKDRNTDSEIDHSDTDAGADSDTETHVFTRIELGLNGGCALDDQGGLHCWGEDHYGITAAPDGVFTDLAVGVYAACALDTAGYLQCWGDTSHIGEALAYAGPLVEIDMEYRHLCAIEPSGATVCWGEDLHGELSAPETEFSSLTTGAYFTCGLTAEGTASCWGYGDGGQTTPPDRPYSHISAGQLHACGIDASTSELVTWGRADNWGDVPAGFGSAVECDHGTDCLLELDGSIQCWGYGVGLRERGPYAAVAVDHQLLVCALTSEGAIECWYTGDDHGDTAELALDVPT